MTKHTWLQRGLSVATLVLLGACTSSATPSSVDTNAGAKPGSTEVVGAGAPNPACRLEKSTDCPGDEVGPAASNTVRLDPATTRMCAVLSNAEVAEAVGSSVTTDDTDPDRCRWQNKSGQKSVALSKSFAPTDPEDIAQRRAGYGKGSWVKSDLGEDGFEGLIFPSIDWIVGEYNFELNVGWSSKGDPIPIAKRLAEMADQRIARPSIPQ
jgi:hypothetical protein